MSRPPDYVIKALNKETDERSGKIGAAWSNPDRSITIVMDPGCSIAYVPGVVYTLFPPKGTP